MVFLKVVLSWSVWLSIAVTFAGVVIINRSKRISTISNSLLTFYALSVGDDNDMINFLLLQ